MGKYFEKLSTQDLEDVETLRSAMKGGFLGSLAGLGISAGMKRSKFKGFALGGLVGTIGGAALAENSKKKVQ